MSHDLSARLREQARLRQKRHDDIYGLLNEAADELEARDQVIADRQSTIERLSRRARVVR